MSRSRPIPWLIILLGVGFTVFTAWSFYRAVHGTSAVIDADYYSHGLRYNQTLLERGPPTSLGWQAVPHLEGRLLSIQLRDHDQQLVTDAQGSLTLLGTGSPPDGALGLREVEPGLYRAELPAGLRGEQTAEIVFQRDGARLTRRLLFAFR